MAELKESASSGVYSASTTTTTTSSSVTPTPSVKTPSSRSKRKREEDEPEEKNKKRRTVNEDKKEGRGKKKLSGEAPEEEEPEPPMNSSKRGTSRRGKKAAAASKDSPTRATPGLAILYPSMEMVRNARPDYRRTGAGYLYLQEKHWQSKSFPRAHFHDIWPSSFRPGRYGLLLHSKVRTFVPQGGLLTVPSLREGAVQACHSSDDRMALRLGVHGLA